MKHSGRTWQSSNATSAVQTSRRDLETQISGCASHEGVFAVEGGEDLAASMAEGLRTGVDGWVDDDLAFAVPWVFSLAEIAVLTFVWHRTEDLMVRWSMDNGLSAHLPDATAQLQQGDGSPVHRRSCARADVR